MQGGCTVDVLGISQNCQKLIKNYSKIQLNVWKKIF
jgi:hypothetical protein